MVAFTFRPNRAGSAGAWIWNRGRGLLSLALPALIVLKLTGVIAWSWWWVLAPLWISGLLLAPVLLVLLILLGWHIRTRAVFTAELGRGWSAVAARTGGVGAVPWVLRG